MRKTAILLSILCAAIWGLWSLAASSGWFVPASIETVTVAPELMAASSSGSFAGGTAEMGTTTPRSWTGTISGKTVTITLVSHHDGKSGYTQFALDDEGNFIVCGDFQIEAPKGVNITGMSFSGKRATDGSPTIFIRQDPSGSAAKQQQFNSDNRADFEYTTTEGVSIFKFDTGGSQKAISIKDLTLTYGNDAPVWTEADLTNATWNRTNSVWRSTFTTTTSTPAITMTNSHGENNISEEFLASGDYIVVASGGNHSTCDYFLSVPVIGYKIKGISFEYAQLSGSTSTIEFEGEEAISPTEEFVEKTIIFDELAGQVKAFTIHNNGGVRIKNIKVWAFDDEMPFETTSIVDGKFADGTKWYHMYINTGGKPLYYEEGATSMVLSTDSEYGSLSSPVERNENLWCFVGNTTDGYKIYNRAAGPTKVLTSPSAMTGTEGGTSYVIVADEGIDGNVDLWDFTSSSHIASSAYMNQHGTAANKVNDRKVNNSNQLAFWTGSADGGSSIRFVECTDLPTEAAEEREWFTMNFNTSGWQLKSNGADSDVTLDKTEGNMMNGNQTDAYLWCREGNETIGYQYFNKALGMDYVLASVDPTGNARTTYLAMKPVTDTSVNSYWTLINSTSTDVTDAFCLRYPGHDNYLVNPNGDKLAFWFNSTTGDNGSSFKWMLADQVSTGDEGEGSFEGGSEAKGTDTPRTWTGTIAEHPVTITLESGTAGIRQFADATDGGFIMNGQFVVTSTDGTPISGVSMNLAPEVDGTPTMYIAEYGVSENGVESAVGQVKPNSKTFSPGVTSFKMHTGGSQKSILVTDFTLTFGDGIEAGANPNTPADNAFTQQQIEFNNTTQSEYASTGGNYRDWIKPKTGVATPNTSTPHVVKIAGNTSSIGWSSGRTYANKSGNFWTMEIKAGTYNVTIDDTANGDVLTGMYLVASPNGGNATTTVGNGEPVTASNGEMFEAKGYVVSGEPLTFTIETTELFIYEIILAYNGANLPCDVLDGTAITEEYTFNGIDAESTSHGVASGGRTSWFKTPTSSNPNKPAQIHFATSDGSNKIGWFSNRGNDERSYINDAGQLVRVDYGGLQVGEFVATTDNEEYRIQSLTMWVRASANGSTIKLGNGTAVSCANTSDTYKVAGSRSGGNSFKIVVSGSEVYVCAIEAVLVGPSVTEVTAEYQARTVTRIHDLAHLTNLGFTAEMVAPYVAQAEEYECNANLTVEQNQALLDAIYLAAVQHADVAMTGDAEQLAFFTMENEDRSGYYLAMNNATPYMFNNHQTRILWHMENNGDGSFAFYNPYNKTYLAVTSAGALTGLETKTDACKFYIDAVTNDNAFSISTTATADVDCITPQGTTVNLTLGPDNSETGDHSSHWVVRELQDADIPTFLSNMKRSVKSSLDIYANVPVLWDAEALATAQAAVEEVTIPTGITNQTFHETATALREALDAAAETIANTCVDKLFYLNQKDNTSIFVHAPADNNGIYRTSDIDAGLIFKIAVAENGRYKIANVAADGSVNYLKVNGSSRYIFADSEDDASWFIIHVTPVNVNTEYGENEISIEDPNGKFINRKGGSDTIIEGWTQDDNGSRWIVAAADYAAISQLAADARQSALDRLSMTRQSTTIWTGDNVKATLDGIESAIRSFDFGISSSASAGENFEKIDAGQTALDALFADALKGLDNASTGAPTFALYYTGAASRGTGYLTANSADMTNPTQLHIDAEITNLGQWMLEATDADNKYHFVNVYTDEAGNEVKNYVKTSPGTSSAWTFSTEASEAGEFYIDIHDKNTISLTTSDNPSTHNGIHRGQGGIVAWTPTSDASHWLVISLTPEALAEQLSSDVNNALNQLNQMKRLPAIWNANDVNDAIKLVNNYATIGSENPTADYVSNKAAIAQLITELNETASDVTLYFTNVGNGSLIGAQNPDNPNSGKLYRQNDPTLNNNVFWHLIPSGTGFKLKNEATGLYFGSNPGTSQQWNTASEGAAATLYLDASFCNQTNMTGISSSSTFGNTGMVFVHANAGQPVCWSGDGDCSRWIVAAATDAEIDGARYKAWLEEAMDATPWGAYALQDGITAIDQAIAAGGNFNLEDIYNNAIANAENTIVEKGVEIPVIIYSVNTGKHLKNTTDPVITMEDESGVTSGNYNINEIWYLEPETPGSDVMVIRSHKWSAIDNADAWIHQLPSQVAGQTATNGQTVFSTADNNPVNGTSPNGTREHALRVRLHLVEGNLTLLPVGELPSLPAETASVDASVALLAEGDDATADEEIDLTADQWRIKLLKGTVTRPTPSTDEAPILYYITNVHKAEQTNKRIYLTARNNTNVDLFKEPQAGSFWYVKDNGDGSCLIVNAAHPNYYLKVNGTMTDDPEDGRIYINNFHDSGSTAAYYAGLYICSSATTRPTNSALSRKNTSNDGADNDPGYDNIEAPYNPRANDYKGTAWIFVPVTEKDELDYKSNVDPTVSGNESWDDRAMALNDMIDYFQRVSPWGYNALEQARTENLNTIGGLTLVGNSTDSSIGGLAQNFLNEALEQIPGTQVIIYSYARLNPGDSFDNFGKPARLTTDTVSGAVMAANQNTVDADAFTFVPSPTTGYFFMVNGEGKFLSASGNRSVTTDISRAGMFRPELRWSFSNGKVSNYWVVLHQSNGSYLSLGYSSDNLGQASSDSSSSTGFEFVRYTPDATGIDGIDLDGSSNPLLDPNAELYDLRGSRIDIEDAAPGIYILRSGGRAMKIVIR